MEGRGGRGGGSRGGSRGGFRSSRTSFRSRSNIRTSRGRFPAGWKVAAGVGLIYGWSSYRHRRSYRNDQSRGRSRSQGRDVQPFFFTIYCDFSWRGIFQVDFLENKIVWFDKIFVSDKPYNNMFCCHGHQIVCLKIVSFSLCQGWGAARNFFTASSDSLFHPSSFVSCLLQDSCLPDIQSIKCALSWTCYSFIKCSGS